MEEEKKKNEEEQIVPTTENNVEKKKSGNKHKGLVIAIIIVIILLILVLLYVLLFTKNEDTDKPQVSPTSSPQQKEKTEDDKNSENINNTKLPVYKYSKDSEKLVDPNSNEPIDFKVEAFSIDVNNTDAKVLSVDTKSLFVLYDDGGLYLYNVKTAKSEKIDLENNYQKYKIFLNEAENRILGITYLNDKYLGYYNVDKKMKMYEGKYESFSTIPFAANIYQINDKTIGIYTGAGDDYARRGILSSVEEKELVLGYKSRVYYDEYFLYKSYGSNNDYVYTDITFDRDGTYYVLQARDAELNPIAEIYWTNVNRFSYYNGYIYYADESSQTYYDIKKIDTKGKLVSSKKVDFGDTDLGLIRESVISNNYFIYINNNGIFIQNIDDDKEIKEIAKRESFWRLKGATYYSRSMLDNIGASDKEEGIYITIDYQDIDANGNYGMEYCYTKDKQIKEYPIKENLTY